MPGPEMRQKFPWGEDLDALTQPGGEMDPNPGDETRHTLRYGDFEKRFVAGVGERFRQWGGRYGLPPDGDKVHQRVDLVVLESKLRPLQDLAVFGKDPRVETERQFAGGNHSDDVAARSERGQKTRHENVRVEDDLHRRRFPRTSLISESISSGDVRSVPCSTERR